METSPDQKSRGDARLEASLAENGIRDPREFCRERLRWLKERDRAAFDRALAHYEQVLVPGAANETTDPLAEWLSFARLLADLSGAGSIVEIDAEGRAKTGAPPAPEHLMLHIPENAATPVLVLRMPVTLTSAQVASVDLLVHGKVVIAHGGH